MASKKLLLVNKSRERRTFPLLRKREGATERSLVTVTLLSYTSMEITQSEISPLLDNLLKLRRVFGLHLEEAKPKPADKKKDVKREETVMEEEGD